MPFTIHSGLFHYFCTVRLLEASRASIVPSIRQSTKIEELFSDLDAGVAALDRAKANLKLYRASVLKAAVEGKLTEQWRKENPPKEPASVLLERILTERRRKWEEERLTKYKAQRKKPPNDWKEKYKDPIGPDTKNLPSLPEGWCCATIDQVSIRVTKGASPNWQGYEYTDSGITFVRSQNVRWGDLDLTEITFLSEEYNRTHAYSVICAGDVLLNLVGASVGRSAVASPEIDGANLNQAVAIIRILPGGLINQLLVHLILSPMLQAHITRTKADVARANFNLDDIRPTPVPLPPLQEQQTMLSEIDQRLTLIFHAEKEINSSLVRASRLRQSILTSAFKGKLVEQDPSDEPASVLLERIKAARASAGGDGKGKGSATTKKKVREISK